MATEGALGAAHSAPEAAVGDPSRVRPAGPLDGDDLGCPELARGHLGGEAVGLFDQGGGDLALGDGLDDLALDEDLALAVAGCHTQVGLAGLPRSVDDATHHGD